MIVKACPVCGSLPPRPRVEESFRTLVCLTLALGAICLASAALIVYDLAKLHESLELLRFRNGEARRTTEQLQLEADGLAAGQRTLERTAADLRQAAAHVQGAAESLQQQLERR